MVQIDAGWVRWVDQIEVAHDGFSFQRATNRAIGWLHVEKNLHLAICIERFIRRDLEFPQFRSRDGAVLRRRVIFVRPRRPAH